MTIGLALGSGGARGWCHIGVLRELEAQGIRPELVAGCSMGALVGAAWAAGALDALEDWARGLTQTRFLQYLDIGMARGGLIHGRAVLAILREIGLPERIEDLPRPFLAVATDMGSGREVWLQKGPLAEAVRASISIPGVFPPQRVAGRWLLDGGLVNPVPASAARALGADIIIAVNPNEKFGRKLWQPEAAPDFWQKMGIEDVAAYLPKPVAGLLAQKPDSKPDSRPDTVTPAYVDVVSTSIEIMTEFLRKTREAADPPHVTLGADLAHISVLEMFRADEAIAEGRRITRDAADRIEAALA